MNPELRTESPPASITVCFHCGLPVIEAEKFWSRILDEPREFCCGGCQAAAEAIRGSGLEDYYRLRTENAPTASAVEDAGDRLFDSEDLQRSFVRQIGNLREVSLALDGVRCPACLWLNERNLQALPGVVEAAVAYAGQSARVVWDPSRISLSEILAAIRRIGYRGRPFDSSYRRDLEPEAARRDTERLVFAGVLGMMIMNVALSSYLVGGPDASGRLALWETFGRWSCLIGAAVMLAYPAQDFFAGAWRDLRCRRAGMDVPIVLGLAAAWLGSAWMTVRGSGPVYYDAIAMLVFFVLLARAMETRARRRAASSLDRFAIVEPARARRIGVEGEEQELAAVDLVPGDIVRVRPGEIAPADGVVLEGDSSFDESVLTGEPWPHRRRPGQPVLAGSVNRDQPVLLRITRAGEGSTLGEIRRLLERGLASRPRFALLADRLAARLVVGVLLLAGATAIGWALRDPPRALPATIAVLIVTCPCALALATPIALALTGGRLAAIGVLPARMEAIEQLACADTVAFDKTGTLTRGVPELADVVTVGNLDRKSAIAIACALEKDSLHPIARAICVAGEGRARLASSDAQHTSEGISGTVEGARWWIGSPEFIRDAQGFFDPERTASSVDREGRHLAFLSNRKDAAAVFAFEEELRRGAREIVDRLRRAGLGRTHLLSGDSPETAGRLARTLGLDEANGGMTPAAKLEWIRSREQSGARVLFVGDGLNDAPTLGAASASVSFAEAPQLPRMASDFLILGRDLSALAAARSIARRSRRLLLQNVGWALGYNIFIVPLAVLGKVPPWAAALGMSASSLAVVANAMRLSRAVPGERFSEDASRASTVPPARECERAR